jgi:hypothetical protein|eukprot:COSAG01_NODE_1306_length_10805_cov_29.835700_3_plen_94_part_00
MMARIRYNDVSVLLQGAPDLLDQFSMFLPEVIRCSIQSNYGVIKGENMDAWWVQVVVLVPVSLALSAAPPSVALQHPRALVALQFTCIYRHHT